MSDSEWTIKRLLDWTSDYFARHETGQPRLDAEVLLAEALACQRIELYTRFDEVVAEEPRTLFRDWVRRHAEGEPVAYLVGHREFFSLEFEVNADVLIPRPETEHLVSEVLDLIKEHFAGQEVRIADVGTGSGCIAVALARHCHQARLMAVDLSAEALEVAKRNASRHQVSERIEWFQSDLLSDVPEKNGIQIVVSNPPYIGQSERDSVSASVKDFEPDQALFATDDKGIQESIRLVEQVGELPAGVFLVMESSPMNIQAIRDKVAEKGFDQIEVRKDLAGLERWLVARRV